MATNMTQFVLDNHGAPLLFLKGVHVRYGGKEVLRGVRLDLDPGEIVTIVGPNGAGKSTLLKVITGFCSSTVGTLQFGDGDISCLAPHEIARLGISYCMQGGRIFPSLTVRQNLSLGGSLLPLAERVETVSEILELFPSLKEIPNRRAGLLSGGERQILALSMLLARRPRLLLLDEPTAGLSPDLASGIIDKIGKINKHLGTTILLVEQNIREALNIAHRAIAMAGGRFVSETKRPHDWLTGDHLDSIFLGKHSSRMPTNAQSVNADLALNASG